MSQSDLAQSVRYPKLAAVALVLCLCFAAGASLLNGALRSVVAGCAVGLACAAAAALMGTYLRRGPRDVSQAVVDKKARLSQVMVTASLLLAALGAFLVKLAPWLFAGYFIGVFAFLGLILSPLFSPAITRRKPPSPLSRMTSMERAARSDYE